MYNMGPDGERKQKHEGGGGGGGGGETDTLNTRSSRD